MSEVVESRILPAQAELIRLLVTSDGYREFKDIIEQEIESTQERLENISNDRDDDMIMKGSIHAMRWVLQIVDEAEAVVLRIEDAEKHERVEHIEQTGFAE